MCTHRYFTSFTSFKEKTHTFRTGRVWGSSPPWLLGFQHNHTTRESKPGRRELPGEDESARRVTVWPGTPEWSVALSRLAGKHHPGRGGTPDVGTAAA